MTVMSVSLSFAMPILSIFSTCGFGAFCSRVLYSFEMKGKSASAVVALLAASRYAL